MIKVENFYFGQRVRVQFPAPGRSPVDDNARTAN